VLLLVDLLRDADDLVGCEALARSDEFECVRQTSPRFRIVNGAL
jgi:hypothetical protein